MLSKDHKKLKLDKGRFSLTNLQTKKVRTSSKLEPKHQRTTSTFNRNHSLKPQNSSTVKSQKSKPKIDNPGSFGKSQHQTQKKAQRKRLISQLVPKQTEIRQTKSMQKNQTKYIFNSIPNNRVQFVSEASKPQNSTLLSHSKCDSNLTLSKHSNGLKNDVISSFGKTTTSDFSKIKKKKHDYIKKFNKTSTSQKSLSSGYQTIDCLAKTNMPLTNIDRTAFSEVTCGRQKQAIEFQVTEQDLQGVRIDNKVPKISQIRHNVSTLFKKLKSPSKAKLLLISNNYEKIVSDLYTAIKRPSLPNCQISRINTNSLDNQTKQNKKPIESAKKSNQRSTYFNTPFSNNQASEDIICSEELSEHWDSYMNLNSEQFRTTNKNKNDNKKSQIIKKLDLHAIKRPDIMQYQDEFMEMKENFSESWKREISQQTRF